MQVYKAYFKIIRRNLGSILIYFGIFLGVSLLITSMLGNTGKAVFSETRSNVAIFNEDAGSPLSDGLSAYLTKTSNIVSVKDDRQAIEDTLFYGNVDYVLRIPKGFGESVLGGGIAIQLEKTAAANSTSGIYMDFLINRYLDMALLYAKNAPGMAASQIAANVEKDLANQAVLDVRADSESADTTNLSYYFRYLAYPILAVLIIGVTSFMMAFNDTDLSNRNQCSPMRPMGMNMQIVLGNITFAAVVWAANCAAVFLMFGSMPLNAGTVLLCLNALALSAVSLSIGFLAGKFIRNHPVQSAVTNVVSLGMCFLSGVFVEQDLLGKSVLNIARFMPGYWYVKAVEDIRNAASYTLQNMLPAITGMLIQLGFAVTIFIVALVLSKQIKLQREI